MGEEEAFNVGLLNGPGEANGQPAIIGGQADTVRRVAAQGHAAFKIPDQAANGSRQRHAAAVGNRARN